MKLAVLTNGRNWWIYLPLQAGSWEQRRFLTIDLEVQEPSVVEHRFLKYLSPEYETKSRDSDCTAYSLRLRPIDLVRADPFTRFGHVIRSGRALGTGNAAASPVL